MIYSLNDYIYFQITESGWNILRKNAKEFHENYPDIDIQYMPTPWKGDIYKEQLHWVLQKFGGKSFVGTLLPIKNISFESPINENAESSVL